MNRRIRILLIAPAALLTSCLLTSCAAGLRREVETVPKDPSMATVKSKTHFYAQLGSKGGMKETAPDGSKFAVGADSEKSFRDAALTAATLGYVKGNVDIKTAESADATKATIAKTEAGTEATRIGATERTIKSVGNNPEANVGAIDAAGNAFKRR